MGRLRGRLDCVKNSYPIEGKSGWGGLAREVGGIGGEMRLCGAEGLESLRRDWRPGRVYGGIAEVQEGLAGTGGLWSPWQGAWNDGKALSPLHWDQGLFLALGPFPPLDKSLILMNLASHPSLPSSPHKFTSSAPGIRNTGKTSTRSDLKDEGFG